MIECKLGQRVKMKVFLGDLVHTWEKVSVWTMPLNIGFIGGYAKKFVPEITEVRLFKRPEMMIGEIKREKPDVVGLANYVWNTKLNSRVMDIAKAVNANTLAVGGGPQFTSLNATEAGARKFFGQYPSFDAHVVNQGERGFVELLREFLAVGVNVKALREKTVAGCLINTAPLEGIVQVGTNLDTIRDLDEIPSPYLTGLLDEFFDEPLNPMIETNRSCPYRCTFCAWGIGTEKLSRFSTERVFDEIDYIAKRCTKAVNIHICDANFAILERDAEIARKLYDCHKRYSFPGVVNVQWNKTRPDRTLRVAKELREIAEIGASMQSFNPATLDAIKRRNLNLDDVIHMVEELNKDGTRMSLFSELILGLPEETWQTHIDANKTLVDIGAQVHNYNLHLLPGTEMDTEESRQTYFKRTGWRLHDNAFGIYDGHKVFEGQEVVLETPTMTHEEVASFRYIHWLIQLMWGRRYYYDFVRLCWKIGLHPVDLAVEVYEAMKTDSGAIGDLYNGFTADYALEHFDTFEDLCDYWSGKEPFERLHSNDYGKLNAVYSHKILLEHDEAFDDFLYRLAEKLVRKLSHSEPDIFLAQCKDILRFNQEMRIRLTDNFELVETKRASFDFDILSWRANEYAAAYLMRYNGASFEYEFFIPEDRKFMLNTKLAQFRSQNVNLTWRKMTEYSNADQFFYEVVPA